MIVFNGAQEWHANVVIPTEKQTLRNATARGLIRNPEQQAQMRKELRAAGLPNFAGIGSQILCFYFQRQQRSYLRNQYNRENPEEPVELSSDEEQLEHEDTDDEDCHNDAPISAYAQARLDRIAQNQAKLNELNIPKL